MTSPLVTVMMPAYNHERFVAHAIESVLNQSFQDWELVIVDDCSTDDTLGVIHRYCDSRIKVFAHERNLGPSAATNTCLREARGKWLGSLPSDDAYAPTRLEEQLSYLENHPQYGMVVTGLRFIDEYNVPILGKHHFALDVFETQDRARAQQLRYFFDHGNGICATGALYDRKYAVGIGGWDRRLLMLQDYDFWVQAVLLGCEIGHLRKPLTDYRILPCSGNLSARSLRTYHQCAYEKTHVLKRFLVLQDVDTLCNIFPEISAVALEIGQEKVWVQHQLALQAWEHGSRSHAHFALETWFSLFSDENHARWLESWGMSVRRFNALTAQTPLMRDTLHDIGYLAYVTAARLLPSAMRRSFKDSIKKWMHRSS